MKLSAKPKADVVHNGAIARIDNDMAKLRRSICSCLLGENEFYEDGVDIRQRIYDLALGIKDKAAVAALAIEVRENMKLRHAPLVLLSALAKSAPGTALVSETIARVIKRPDDMVELLALHAFFNKVSVDKIKPVISAQMKKGIAAAFVKFDAYQLGKYNREHKPDLKDIMFLTHPKPANDEQKKIWEDLINGNLAAPDTWEVALSGGADKKETFTRLLKDNKLGYLALLRNLRNMVDAGVDRDLIIKAITARRGADMVLPFRYIAAARACPQMEPALDKAMIASVAEMKQFDGLTAVLVDVSGSMSAKLSAKSDLSRMDAAAALGAILPGDKRVFSFSNRTVEVPARAGMGGVEAIVRSQAHSGTQLIQAVRDVAHIRYDRLIIITDEQANYDARGLELRGKDNYIINVASYRNGISFNGKATVINGFSEAVFSFVREYERLKIEDLL